MRRDPSAEPPDGSEPNKATDLRHTQTCRRTRAQSESGTRSRVSRSVPSSQAAEDLSPRPASDVLATLYRDDQVEPPTADGPERFSPDPSLEIKPQPVIRRLEYFQTHAGTELPQQRPVLLSSEIFLSCQRPGLALNGLGDREEGTENTQDPRNPQEPGRDNHLTETILDRRC